MWQYILIVISALMLFGFMAIGVVRYGFLSCYSAYGPKWHEFYPKLNIWSVITFISAALMIPVLLEQAMDNIWQFLGFLAPVSLTLVAASPNYQTDTFANIMHQCGAWGAVLFIVLYSILIPHLVWIVIALVLLGLIIGFIQKGTLLFWEEVAIYLSTYVILIFNI